MYLLVTKSIIQISKVEIRGREEIFYFIILDAPIVVEELSCDRIRFKLLISSLEKVTTVDVLGVSLTSIKFV